MKETIKNLREHFRYSQTQMAAIVGVSRQMYIKYENGETEPGIKVLCKLSSVYNVPYEVIIENRYKDGVPEKRDYAETIDLKKFRASEKYSSSGTCISDAMPAYEYSTQRPAPLVDTLRQIHLLVKKLDYSEKLKLASSLIESSRIDCENEEHRIKAQSEDRIGMGYLTKKESLEILNEMAGCIKDKENIDVKELKCKYLDEKYGV